jgi:hypothetical protein
VVCGNFGNKFSPMGRIGLTCMFFTIKRNIAVAERSTCAPTARMMVRSCRNFKEYWSRSNALDLYSGGASLRPETGYPD